MAQAPSAALADAWWLRTPSSTSFSISAAGTPDTANLTPSLLQERMRHIVPIAHAELVGVRRAHAVAAVIEDAAGENVLLDELAGQQHTED
jgi:hypothetical protein